MTFCIRGHSRGQRLPNKRATASRKELGMNVIQVQRGICNSAYCSDRGSVKNLSSRSRGKNNENQRQDSCEPVRGNREEAVTAVSRFEHS